MACEACNEQCGFGSKQKRFIMCCLAVSKFFIQFEYQPGIKPDSVMRCNLKRLVNLQHDCQTCEYEIDNFGLIFLEPKEA